MGSLYRRGNRLWIRYRGSDGKWTQDSTGLPHTEEKRARKMLERVESQISAGLVPVAGGPLTVAAYVDVWLKDRKLAVDDWSGDFAKLRDHVLPTIGKLPVADVRARHLVELARTWRTKTPALAPKTVFNIYSVCCALFRDAQLSDLIDASPCILTKRQLGDKVDANPEWRATAVFNRDELEQLLSDTRLSQDRRVMYGLAGLGGLRHGEAAGLRWRHIDTTTKPLGQLVVATSYDKGTTKTGAARYMPVHPTLAAMLAEWKASGWRTTYGRAPKPDDLVLPRLETEGEMRSKQYTLERFQKDLTTLELRRRRFHDLRRTMISLARSDGANRDILRRGTHKAPREVMEGYTTFEFDVLAREVSKLQVSRRNLGQVVRLAVGAPPVLGERLATAFATADESCQEIAALSVLRPGLEPRQATADEHPRTPVDAEFEAIELASSTGETTQPDDGCSNVASDTAQLLQLFEGAD